MLPILKNAATGARSHLPCAARPKAAYSAAYSVAANQQCFKRLMRPPYGAASRRAGGPVAPDVRRRGRGRAAAPP